MGHVTRNEFQNAPASHASTAEVSLGDGLLSVQYCVADPGQCGPRKESRHCLVVPVQNTPMRCTIIRDRIVREFTLTWGDIALAQAGSEVAWHWHDPAKVVLVWIDPDAFQRFIEHEMRLILRGNSLDGEIVVNDPDLTLAASRMRDAILTDEIGTDIVFEAQARVFLVILVRHYGLAVSDRDSTGIGQAQFVRLTDYIEAHIDRKIVVSDLAQLLGMSDAVFSRRFKERLGKTPMRFVSEYRLEIAARLIAQSDLSFGQIALRCGYSDQAHMTRSFKKVHALTPRQFRRNQSPPRT